MSTLTQASYQWATRPLEERFTSLPAMREKLEELREYSRASVVSSRGLSAIPTAESPRDHDRGPERPHGRPD